jgi:sugar/nucleoside kinase (ribokinase family)
VTLVAAMGHLTRDVVAGAAPRPGGGIFYAARALARLGATARISTSCAAADRPLLLPPLEAFGFDVAWHESSTTTSYSFHYEGDRRIMWQDAVGDPWTPAQAVGAAGDAAWVDVCALTRTDFRAETLGALAGEGRQLLVDAQGLVRTATIGPLHTDGHVGDVLRHLEVLKLNDEEAETLVGSSDPSELRALGIPEVLLTVGSQGSWVVTPELVERVPAVEVDGPVDPTGAGDTYSVAYLVHPADGAEPVEAARLAAETVSALLATPPVG